MRARAVSVCLFLAFLCAGCLGVDPSRSDAEASPAPLGAVDELPLDGQQGLDLVVNGTGWGRLSLVASEEMTVNAFIEHEGIDDLTIFSRDPNGTATYDENNYTFVFMFREDSVSEMVGPDVRWTPFGGEFLYYFWWGTPNWSMWPESSTDWGDVSKIELDAGEKAVLLVANTVPGYKIKLRTGRSEDAPAAAEHRWSLDAHPEHHLLLPPAEDETLLDHSLVRVKKAHSWGADLPQLSPSILVARWWVLKEDTVQAGLIKDESIFRPTGDCASADAMDLDNLYRPTYTLVEDGRYASATTYFRFAGSTCDYEFGRYWEEHTAGPQNVELGAALVTIPFF